MFKRLRNRMLLVNMLIISALLVGSFSVIFITTSHNVSSVIEENLLHELQTSRFADTKRRLDGKTFPRDSGAKRSDEAGPMRKAPDGEPPMEREETRDGEEPLPDVPDSDAPKMSASFSFAADAEGNVTEVRSPFEVTDESYKSEIPDIIASGRERGFIKYSGGMWAYLCRPYEDGYAFALRDATFERTMLRNLIIILTLVGLAALAAAFFISLISANRSIKPVEESYNKQKQFVADASHELKTPLTTVITNADVLLSHGDSTINEERKWIEYIKSETERMTKLTNDLLYLARLDHSGGNPPDEVSSFSAAAEEVILTMEAVIFEKNIDFNYEIEDDINARAPSERLKQLVLILLDNAVKYTPEKGSIELSLKRGKNGDGVLRVINSGSGISEQDCGLIFERFYRADKSRARESGGYGLGLAIAKAAAEQSGGSIAVSSDGKSRTEFSVCLPCN